MNTRLLWSFGVLICVGMMAAITPSANAMEPTWIDASIDFSIPPSGDAPFAGCVKTNVQFMNFQGPAQGDVSTSAACVYQAKDFSIARFLDYPVAYKWGIKMTGSDAYVHVDNFTPGAKIYVSKNSNRLIYLGYAPGSIFETTLSTIEDLTDSLDIQSSDVLLRPVIYRINDSRVSRWFDYEQSSVPGVKQYLPVYSVAISQNGRYILAWVNNAGHVKIDLDERHLTLISNMRGSPSTSPYSPDNIYNPISGAITDDGRYAFVNNGPQVIDSQNCGFSLTTANIQNSALFGHVGPNCPSFEYQVADVVGYSGYAANYEWTMNGNTLRFRYLNFHGYLGDVRVVDITKAPSSADSLDYLALGDSFSSGEGDIGKQADESSFYLPGTNDKNGCHVSGRSYPFVLARLNNMQPDRVRNVACSGARIANDYHGQSSDYLGQSGQLKDNSESERTEARGNALEEFTPGILKQIDFVKENQPKFVTLTGGGNDVGFGPVLNECAASVASTCSYALSGDDMTAVLGSSIKQQYESMRTTIAAIQEVSPNTTIYVVGYPKFLTSEALSCGGNAGALDRRERTAINEGVAYLNDVIQAAAVSSGAHYLDIEESLSGGRLCESAKYVTGAIDAFVAGDLAQAYHPNAAGHEKMAHALIENASFRLDNVNPEADASADVPAIPSYFGADESVRAERKESIVNKYLSVRSKVMFTIQKGVFKAASRASINIHSKAKNLGTHTVASDGSLVVSRNLPNDIPTGYHTVLIKGIDPQGTPLWLYQFVYVEGSEPDTDKDGIPNGVDKCQFRAQSFDESAQKFVCAGKL